MPIELPTGSLSPEDGIAIGTFLLEMALLERAVTRALLDLYASDDHRELFVRTFLRRMTLGPKCEAMIAAAANETHRCEFSAGQLDDVAKQIRELVRVRNAVAHEAPRFLHVVDESDRYDVDDPWTDVDVQTTASYGEIEVADLI